MTSAQERIEKARELAEFMFKNPEYKVLFDASRKVKKEDIGFVKEMIDRMRGSSDDTGCQNFDIIICLPEQSADVLPPVLSSVERGGIYEYI